VEVKVRVFPRGRDRSRYPPQEKQPRYRYRARKPITVCRQLAQWPQLVYPPKETRAAPKGKLCQTIFRFAGGAYFQDLFRIFLRPLLPAEMNKAPGGRYRRFFLPGLVSRDISIRGLTCSDHDFFFFRLRSSLAARASRAAFSAGSRGGNVKGEVRINLATAPLRMHCVQTRSRLGVPSAVVTRTRWRFGRNFRRVMPVIFVPTPPRYLGFPRLAT